MFSNLLVLDGYHGVFASQKEVQTLVDQSNHWFWAHRISQLYRLGKCEDHEGSEVDISYAAGSRSPCAFIPINDESDTMPSFFGQAHKEDPGDAISQTFNGPQRSMRYAYVGESAEDCEAMYEFKLMLCPYLAPHDWTQCRYAHEGEVARRRNPETHSAFPCSQYEKTGSCARGESCPFAHGVWERGLHPQRYRTSMCSNGGQCNRQICFFAHSEAQLRKPASGFGHRMSAEAGYNGYGWAPPKRKRGRGGKGSAAAATAAAGNASVDCDAQLKSDQLKSDPRKGGVRDNLVCTTDSGKGGRAAEKCVEDPAYTNGRRSLDLTSGRPASADSSTRTMHFSRTRSCPVDEGTTESCPAIPASGSGTSPVRSTLAHNLTWALWAYKTDGSGASHPEPKERSDTAESSRHETVDAEPGIVNMQGTSSQGRGVEERVGGSHRWSAGWSRLNREASASGLSDEVFDTQWVESLLSDTEGDSSRTCGIAGERVDNSSEGGGEEGCEGTGTPLGSSLHSSLWWSHWITMSPSAHGDTTVPSTPSDSANQLSPTSVPPQHSPAPVGGPSASLIIPDNVQLRPKPSSAEKRPSRILGLGCASPGPEGPEGQEPDPAGPAGCGNSTPSPLEPGVALWGERAEALMTHPIRSPGTTPSPSCGIGGISSTCGMSAAMSPGAPMARGAGGGGEADRRCEAIVRAWADSPAAGGPGGGMWAGGGGCGGSNIAVGEPWEPVGGSSSGMWPLHCVQRTGCAAVGMAGGGASGGPWWGGVSSAGGGWPVPALPHQLGAIGGDVHSAQRRLIAPPLVLFPAVCGDLEEGL